jgi:hypothetical protein
MKRYVTTGNDVRYALRTPKLADGVSARYARWSRRRINRALRALKSYGRCLRRSPDGSRRHAHNFLYLCQLALEQSTNQNNRNRAAKQAVCIERSEMPERLLEK